MINVSNAFRQELYKDNRNYLGYVDITLKNGRELNLTNKELWQGGLSIEDAVSSDNSFDVGMAIINKCTVVINNIYEDFSVYDFTDAKVVVRVGLMLPNGTVESVRKGVYAVDETNYNGSIITLSCLDNMRKFDKVYTESKLIYPATLGEIVRDACSVCNVILQTQSFPHIDFVIQERPQDEAITFRDVISWVAQIAGCFCRCDIYGRLELKWYDQEALEAAGLDGGIFDKTNPSIYESGDNADGGSFKPWNAGYEFDGGTFLDLRNVNHLTSNYSMNISVDDVVITGVRVLEKTQIDEKEAIVTYQSGSDGYVVSIENNALIQGGAGQQIANWLGEQLIGFRFRKGEINHPSDPTIEAGDVGFLTDRRGNTYRIVVSATTFSTGSYQNTRSNAENPARNSADIFSAQTKNYVENRKDIKQEISSYDKTVQEMTEFISQGFGMYITSVPQEDGSKKWYMHDKPRMEESSYLLQMTSNGLMASVDGGTTWAVAKNGDALFRVITARGLNADWVNTGILRVGPVGEETLYANFLTKEVRIVADSFRLASGETIESIAEDKSNTALSLAKQYTNGEILSYSSSVNSSFSVVNNRIAAEVTRATQAEGIIDGKITTVNENLSSQITQTAESIISTVSETYETKNDAGTQYNSLSSQISQTASKISSKVSKGDVSSEISQEAGKISIESNRLSINSTYFKLTESGAITATSGTIGGFTISASKIYAGDASTGVIAMQKPSSNMNWAFAVGGTSHDNYSDCPFRVSKAGKVHATEAVISGNSTFSGSLSAASGTFSGSLNAASGTFAGNLSGANGTFGTLRAKDFPAESGAQLFLNGSTVAGVSATNIYKGRIVFVSKVNQTVNDYTIDIDQLDENGVRIRGSFKVTGTKAREVRTKNYEDRLLYCYEMTSPIFGDIGEAVTDKNGECLIYLDDIFSETISPEIEYQVFLQKEGYGDVWVEEKNSVYFLVKGAENLKFAWEIKAKQKGFEFERLETTLAMAPVQSEDELMYGDDLEVYIKEQEELLYETT